MENNEEILKKISSGDPEAIAEAVDTVKENGDLVIAGKLLDILSHRRQSLSSPICWPILKIISSKTC